MERKITLSSILLAIIYILLTIIVYKASMLFLPLFLLMFLLLKKLSSNDYYFIISSYILSSSFFGVSMFGIKIFDIVLGLSFIYLLFTKKIQSISPRISIFIIFLMYIIFEYLFINSMRIPNNLGGYIEIERYIFAFIALLTFSQKCFSNLNKEKLTRNIDYLSILLIFQTIVMFFCHNLFGNLEKAKSDGLLTINIFSYNTTNNNFSLNADSEARVSAFFSDPNKLMIFFFCLLLVRKILTKDRGINRCDFIYIIGALLTGARTSVIVALIYLVVAVIKKYSEGHQIVDYTILISFILIINIVYMFQDKSVISIFSDLMTAALKLFGRDRTLAIDSNLSSDGRIVIWKNSLQFIKQHFIFGNGLLSEQVLLPYPTHNTVVQLLLDTGIVGFLLYLFGITKMIINNQSFIYFVILVGIPSLFLDLANYNFVFFVLGLMISFGLNKINIENGAN